MTEFFQVAGIKMLELAFSCLPEGSLSLFSVMVKTKCTWALHGVPLWI